METSVFLANKQNYTPFTELQTEDYAFSAPKRVRKNTAKTLRFVVSAYQNYITITRAYDMRHSTQVNEAAKLSAAEREIK